MKDDHLRRVYPRRRVCELGENLYLGWEEEEKALMERVDSSKRKEKKVEGRRFTEY